MKWTYRIEQKFKTALALAVVFVLVLATNRVNKSHFSEIQASFNSVYKDRLVVEKYIFQLSALLNQKRLLLYDAAGPASDIQKSLVVGDSIRKLIDDYQRTKFTESETQLFTDFKAELEQLQKLEKSYFEGESSTSIKYNIESKHQQLAELLSGLSDIQMKEGQSLMDQSNDLIATNNSFSSLEIAILIIMGLVVQVLVLSSKPITARFPQNKNLN